MLIIASDYDGTLNQGGISKEVRESVRLFRERGNLFGIVSGRSIDSLVNTLSSDLIECDYFIANNGAVIASGKGDILYESRADSQRIKPLLDFIVSSVPRESAGVTFGYDGIEVVKQNPSIGRITPGEYDKIPYFNQISTVAESTERAKQLAEELNLRFDGYITAYSNGWCIDIVPYNVSKASGVKIVASLFGCSEENVIAAGDNINDLSMIEAYRSYAVGKAVEEVRSSASCYAKDIAEIIKKELSI